MFENYKNAQDFYQVSSFLRDTWFEIPDRTSTSRSMRPRFMKRPKGGSKDLGAGNAKEEMFSDASALYVSNSSILFLTTPLKALTYDNLDAVPITFTSLS